MQIICNDCFSGFLNREINREFENPFYWMRIYAKDFSKLIENYEDLNLEDVDIKLNRDYTSEFKLWPCDALSPVIVLDNGIRIFFNHYKYSEKDITPRKAIPDVFYHKNYEYCLDKWKERSKRITREEPTIIFHWNDKTNDSENDVQNVISACEKKKYKLILISDHADFKDTENSKFLYISDIFSSVEGHVKALLPQILDLIKL